MQKLPSFMKMKPTVMIVALKDMESRYEYGYIRGDKRMIQVTRQSIITKKMNTMELPITQENLDTYDAVGDILVQDAFPHLDIGQREFILSGITPDEWHETFGDDENE